MSASAHHPAAPPVIQQWKGTSILSVAQFERRHLDDVFKLASAFLDGSKTAFNTCQGKILANLFYEPSTRTSSSFHAAMLKLGGSVVSITDVKNSSVSKGETLADTVRTLQSYADVIALRHPQVGSAAEAASYLDIPLMNAGDGAGEHPTQALLDCFTMLTELGTIDGLVITMVGDLKHGRTVHSLARVLKHFKVTLNYVSPDFLQMPADVVQEVGAAGIQQNTYTTLDECLPSTDVLYVTRVQKERFEDLALYEKAQGAYIVTPQLLQNAKQNMRILHPLPRVGEISEEVDKDPRAAYFRQMRCGLFVRMALLHLTLVGQ